MQVLMDGRTFERLRARFAAELPGVSVVGMAQDGSLKLVHGPEQAVAPAIAWGELELYDSGPVRDFMVYCLKCESLRFFQSGGAGVDHPVFGMLADRGVLIANSDANCVAVAEYAFGCVFDAFQPFEQRRALQSARSWERTPGRELQGARLLVVGMGAIGRAVTVRARACGMHVTGVRRTPSPDDPADRMVTPGDLSEVLPETDVVIVCAAANPGNTHMFGGPQFALMRATSVFVNVARGSLVDESALLEALDRGVPERAYLDVFAQEPLPEDSRLWSHPRARVSGHTAGSGTGVTRRNDDLFFTNVARMLAGQQPMRLVPGEQVRAAVVPS